MNLYTKLIADEEGVTWAIEQELIDNIVNNLKPKTEAQLFEHLGYALDFFKTKPDASPFFQVGFVNAR